MKLSTILKLVGPAIGIIAALSLISNYPITIGVMLIGVATYFAGVYYKKKGK